MTHHDPQSDLLKSWRHEPAEAVDFNARVWARIAAQRPVARPVLFYRWALPLAASLALIAGAGTALLQADQRYDDQMAAALVRSIDPWQMTTTVHQHAP